MDKWATNMSCDGMELSSDTELSEMFGEIGYKSKIQNIRNNKRRILPSSPESASENIEELPDSWKFLWSSQNLAPKVFDFDEQDRHTGCLERNSFLSAPPRKG
ncbi:hypothetical protein HNY73_006414 [Argiope bruennichi]|uniref:Uncharacterized protein n=1 Tax=Argiope bruennichi TaxID=94029 RepID=A0A8T0FPL6_ARGBR|nr:hypothetical protein HNY73_006414 [Argiope bruennichi]